MGLRQLRIGTGKLVVRVPAAESSLTTALGDANAEGPTDRGSTPRTSTTSTYDRSVGLAAELGYECRTDNAFRRWLMRIGATKSISAVSRIVLPPADRFLLRLTHGRLTVSALLIGLPPLWLATTGARSGAPRTVPLFAFPSGDDLALLGTSFGQHATPAWVYNIEGDPNVVVSYRGVSVPSRARPARPDEEPGIWQQAGSIYPGYLSYEERASHRRIRLFVLESRSIR